MCDMNILSNVLLIHLIQYGIKVIESLLLLLALKFNKLHQNIRDKSVECKLLIKIDRILRWRELIKKNRSVI